MSFVRKAIYFAIGAHSSQKYGEHPYHYHLTEVDNLVKMVYADDPDYETLRAVAWLHDTIEDTKTTFELIQENFNDEIAHAVNCLTKIDGQPYMVYLDIVCSNELARKVKMCDTLANLQNSIKDGNVKRINKYTNQYKLLNEGF